MNKRKCQSTKKKKTKTKLTFNGKGKRIKNRQKRIEK